jgi:predicted acyltransferase
MMLPKPSAAERPASQAWIAETPATQRLLSVDALRGVDMFWIIGADSLAYALERMNSTPVTRFLAGQLDHVDWEGLHFYDLIFPLFVFIVGVSLVFSLTKTLERAGRAEALKRIFRRSVLLYLCGMFYHGGLSHPWPDVRFSGVLNRIALDYFFAAVLFCFFKPRALAGIFAGLLIGYWALMTFVPIRDIYLTREHLAMLAEKAGDANLAAQFRDKALTNPTDVKDSPVWAATKTMFYATTNWVSGKFDQGRNLSEHLDFQYLPGHFKAFEHEWAEPQGYLSTLPSIGTCLLGVFAGLLLKNQKIQGRRKVLYLISFGIASALVGWLWSIQFPIIKRAWTSSYVLVSGGYSAILLGIFYLIVDVWQARTWCQPFVWLGMNAITVYLVAEILGGFSSVAVRFAGGDVKAFFDAHVAKGFGEMMISLVGIMLAFWFVRFLYQRKVFIRL